MLDIYRDGFMMLWKYPEFRVALNGLRYALLMIVVALLAIIVLHVVYLLGFNSPLYKKHSPTRHWSKRFFPSVTVLCLVVIGIYWLLGEWIKTAL